MNGVRRVDTMRSQLHPTFPPKQPNPPQPHIPSMHKIVLIPMQKGQDHNRPRVWLSSGLACREKRDSDHGGRGREQRAQYSYAKVDNSNATETMTASPIISLRTASFTAGTILVTGILLHQRKSITTCYRRRRGIGGIARWIWLGDYLPPQLRQSMDALDEVEILMAKSEQELEQIEVSVERIRLESVDDEIMNSTPSEDTENSSIFQQNPELRTQIGIFSNNLDKLAAKIDSIKSHSDEEVKQRKKCMSNGIVKLMNDLDTMIASFDSR